MDRVTKQVHKCLTWLLAALVLLAALSTAVFAAVEKTAVVDVLVRVNVEQLPPTSFTVQMTPLDRETPEPDQTAQSIVLSSEEPEGSLQFSVRVTHAGEFRYLLHLEKGDAELLEYDSTEFIVTLHVTEQNDELRVVITAENRATGQKPDMLCFWLLPAVAPLPPDPTAPDVTEPTSPTEPQLTTPGGTEPGPTQPGRPGGTPYTGDDSQQWVTLAFVFVSLFGAIVLYGLYFRKRKEER